MPPLPWEQEGYEAPSLSLCKGEVVVGAILLSFWCYMGEPEFNLGHSFDLKGFFDW